MKVFIAKNWLLASGTLWFLLLFKLLWYKTKAWSTVQCKQETLQNIEHYHQQYHNDDKAHNVSSKGTLLSRSKRFISFPLGSSFSTSICMTTGVIGNPNQSYLSMGLNWGIAYDLPNITWVLAHAHGFKASTRQQTNMMDVQIKRRHRRALYNKLEVAISRTKNAYVVESSLLDPSLKNTTLTGRTAPHLSSLSSSPSSPLLTTLTQRQQAQEHLLSRPKRYLSFPEGSSFSVAVCFTVGIIGNPRFDYMSFGLNWGVAYDLPNTTWILNHLRGFGKHPAPLATWHRRNRRNLYKEIEIVMDNMGYNGRDCVLRALCESRQYFRQQKMSMIGEMLRTIFSLPKQRIFTRELDEHSDIVLYDHAYREAHSVTRCEEQYHRCGFSLLELAFGRYSKAPKGY
ncbi:uncharacterized protein LOC119639039 [Glossina fuscipes]|uniref:Uncharacterized protein LOC119639039 n=1 Tax=Glossina fuscipes TaxID=7396 RepID=A0A9C5Z306_9MUSC|nr:uncharacterized protein LOC119639039 [Glossina fuscipes]